MIERDLGNTGLKVSEIGFGSWAIGGVAYRDGVPSGWAGTGMKRSIQTVERAWEQGVTFFDTADAYGRGKSEVLLSLGLGDHRVILFAPEALTARQSVKTPEDWANLSCRQTERLPAVRALIAGNWRKIPSCAYLRPWRTAAR